MNNVCPTCDHGMYVHGEKGCDCEGCECTNRVPPPPPLAPIPVWVWLGLGIMALWIYGSIGYGLIMMLLPHIGWLSSLFVMAVIVLIVGLLLLGFLESIVIYVVRTLGRAWRGEI